MDDKKEFISVKLPRDWEEIDFEHMYNVVTNFTFISSDVTQAEHDMVTNLCIALENLQKNNGK